MKVTFMRMAIIAYCMSFGVALFADEYTEAKARYDELVKAVQQKSSELTKLRKDNPACLLADFDMGIINLKSRYGDRDQKKYYLKQVTYVRSEFYCTGCRCEHGYDGGDIDIRGNRVVGRGSRWPLGHECKTSSKKSWFAWKEAYRKIPLTQEYNRKIDAAIDELEALKLQEAEAKRVKDAAFEARPKVKPKSKKGKAKNSGTF